jgi:hypothetical protein
VFFAWMGASSSFALSARARWRNRRRRSSRPSSIAWRLAKEADSCRGIGPGSPCPSTARSGTTPGRRRTRWPCPQLLGIGSSRGQTGAPMTDTEVALVLPDRGKAEPNTMGRRPRPTPERV